MVIRTIVTRDYNLIAADTFEIFRGYWMHVCRGHAHMPQCICGSQKTAWRSKFCPVSLWFPEIDHKISGGQVWWGAQLPIESPQWLCFVSVVFLALAGENAKVKQVILLFC